MGSFNSGDRTSTPIDDFAKVRAIAAQGAQRQVGGADGDQRGDRHARATPSTWRWRSCATPCGTEQAKDDADRARLDADIAAQKAHVRQIVEVLEDDLQERRGRDGRAAPSSRRTSPRSSGPPPTSSGSSSTAIRSRRSSSSRTTSRRWPRTPTCCSCATSAPIRRRSPAVLRPHEDRRRHRPSPGASAASCSRSSPTRTS